uniref:Uncharacterized protein n=1 Tax=Arundo donax TaxID=35708 RepID=A0A0A9GQX8_ARUDO
MYDIFNIEYFDLSSLLISSIHIKLRNIMNALYGGWLDATV